MKGNLANNGRCPKCTLKPPCKHYESIEQMMGSQTQTSKISELGQQRALQGTPDRGMFYPENSAVSGSGVSITNTSDAKFG